MIHDSNVLERETIVSGFAGLLLAKILLVPS